jgi:rRNA-processing protein FCF1
MESLFGRNAVQHDNALQKKEAERAICIQRGKYPFDCLLKSIIQRKLPTIER